MERPAAPGQPPLVSTSRVFSTRRNRCSVGPESAPVSFKALMNLVLAGLARAVDLAREARG